MIEIIPAIMPKTFHELREQVEAVSGLVSTVQIDVMDGIFVPEKSWPYSEDDSMVESFARENEGLPLWEEIDFEIDLMVTSPEDIVADWLSVCSSRIILHIDSIQNPEKTIPDIRGLIDSKRDRGECLKPLELGVAVSMETSLDNLYKWAPFIDFVQLMGIARIGYQGEPFDERVISKIKSLREVSPDVIISIDGGVNLKSVPKLVEAGANRLVAGSAIFASNNIAEAIDALSNAANKT